MTYRIHGHEEGEPCNDWCSTRPGPDFEAITYLVCMALLAIFALLGLWLW